MPTDCIDGGYGLDGCRSTWRPRNTSKDWMLPALLSAWTQPAYPVIELTGDPTLDEVESRLRAISAEIERAEQDVGSIVAGAPNRGALNAPEMDAFAAGRQFMFDTNGG